MFVNILKKRSPIIGTVPFRVTFMDILGLIIDPIGHFNTMTGEKIEFGLPATVQNLITDLVKDGTCYKLVAVASCHSPYGTVGLA
jgi:hypothetical protein